jgi:hypothetical protein
VLHGAARPSGRQAQPCPRDSEAEKRGPEMTSESSYHEGVWRSRDNPREVLRSRGGETDGERRERHFSHAPKGRLGVRRAPGCEGRCVGSELVTPSPNRASV